MLPQDTMTSRKGFFRLTAGTKTGSFVGFVPVTETVVTAMEINNLPATLADFGINGTAWPPGFPVLFADNENITSITITGSAYLIRR